MALKNKVFGIISALPAPKNGFCKAISYKYVISHVNFFEPIEPVVAASNSSRWLQIRTKIYGKAYCWALWLDVQTRICRLRYDVDVGWVFLLDIEEIETP